MLKYSRVLCCAAGEKRRIPILPSRTGMAYAVGMEQTGCVTFRFYEELNDLLPENRRKRDFAVPLAGRRSVKDAIESLNVPHTEVDLILINGVPTGFDALLEPGDRVSVYPLFESLDIAGVQRLRERALRDPQFVCDVHLGKLAGKLRLLGFDTLYRNDYGDAELVAIQEAERRAILTCDRNLLKSNRITRGCLVRSRVVAAQVREVVHRFDLAGDLRPFTRCAVCNGILADIDAATARPRVPAQTAAWCDRYRQCASCGKLYWEGTHFARIESWVAGLRGV